MFWVGVKVGRGGGGWEVIQNVLCGREGRTRREVGGR